MIAGVIRLITGVQARWADGAGPVDADGRPRQRIYFANHASHLDAPVIWAALPAAVRARPVAARDYWERTAVHRYLARRVFRAVLIDRSPTAEDGTRRHPLAEVNAALTAGDSIILFPTGTRAAGDPADDQAPYKPGLWHLARDHPAAELVPVRLENLNRILPKGDVLPVPLIAAVTFGRPIRVGEGEAKGAFLDRARQAVRDLEPAD